LKHGKLEQELDLRREMNLLIISSEALITEQSKLQLSQKTLMEYCTTLQNETRRLLETIDAQIPDIDKYLLDAPTVDDLLKNSTQHVNNEGLEKQAISYVSHHIHDENPQIQTTASKEQDLLKNNPTASTPPKNRNIFTTKAQHVQPSSFTKTNSTTNSFDNLPKSQSRSSFTKDVSSTTLENVPDPAVRTDQMEVDSPSPTKMSKLRLTQTSENQIIRKKRKTSPQVTHEDATEEQSFQLQNIRLTQASDPVEVDPEQVISNITNQEEFHQHEHAEDRMDVSPLKRTNKKDVP